jgi:2-polyprenyl-3-methyl-5-hydroxy-6-metoxy-1,4-benzoquinol methylase
VDYKQQLVQAYNSDVAGREIRTDCQRTWKDEVRDDFVKKLNSEGKKIILDMGAGLGKDALYFSELGFEVMAIDIADKMVEKCVEKGIDAKLCDLYDIRTLDKKFDAIYSMNVMLHVPRTDLDIVLNNIVEVMKKDGLFFYGVYSRGSDVEEYIVTEDNLELPRMFSFLSDETVLKVTGKYFRVVEFKKYRCKDPGFYFQALTLRKD